MRQILCTAAGLLCAIPAATQTQFSPLIDAALPARPDNGRAVAVGDIDGDNVADVVIGRWGYPPAVFLGRGGGTFSLGQIPAGAVYTRAVVLADIDGDFDLDVILGNAPAFGATGQNELYLNDGLGKFTDVTTTRMPVDTSATAAIAAGDIDGDFDLDLVIGNGDDTTATGQQNRVYLNNGGTFVDATARLPVLTDMTTGVQLADLDNDNDLDLVVANGDFDSSTAEQDRLYANDGSGNFTDITAGNFPNTPAVTNGVAIADLDDDTDPDIVVARGGPLGGTPSAIYFNQGGIFTQATTSTLPVAADATRGVYASDIDADGFVDLVFANYGTPDRIYQNDKKGAFFSLDTLPHELQPSRAIAVADLDNDFLPDLLEVGDVTPALFLNLGFGKFFDTRTGFELRLGPRRSEDIRWCDANNDGNTDLLLLTNQPGIDPLTLLLGDARGNFDLAPATLPASLQNTVLRMAIGDTNGDGNVDVVVATDGPNLLYLGDGLGHFSDGSNRLPADAEDSRAIALHDVDGDTDLDIVLADAELGQTRIRVYRNDGAALFTTTTSTFAVPEHTAALALGDVNGDSTADLVLGNGAGASGEINSIWLNDGSGLFSPAATSTLPSDAEPTADIALVDTDGDTDLDIVVANGAPGGSGAAGRIYVNDGSGNFSDDTAALLPVPANESARIASGDFDEDGDCDLLFTSFDGGSIHLYLNRDNLTFDDGSARLPAAASGETLVAIADVDRDRDLDILNAGTSQHLLINNHRQLHSTLFARSGFPYTIAMASQPGYGVGNHTVFLFIAFGELSPPLSIGSLGTLFLDPSLMLNLPPIPLPSTGRTMFSVTLPNLLPPLIGLTLYTQAVTTPSPLPSTWRLGNTIADTVVR